MVQVAQIPMISNESLDNSSSENCATKCFELPLSSTFILRWTYRDLRGLSAVCTLLHQATDASLDTSPGTSVWSFATGGVVREAGGGEKSAWDITYPSKEFMSNIELQSINFKHQLFFNSVLQ